MRESSHIVQVGAKRKRVANTNENARTYGTRSGRLKRLRSASGTTKHYSSTSEESGSDLGEMEVDSPSEQRSDDSEPGDQEEEQEEDAEQEEEEEDGSTDDCLLHSAPLNRLNRLRKPDLIRLYNVAGLPDDPELLTKSEITDAIVAARDDVASLPPSSPPGKGDGASSDYSSDDGNVAGDEETDVGSQLTQSGPGTLRRRVTHDWGKTIGRPLKGRSLSMGHLLGPVEGSNPVGLQRKSSTRLSGDSGGSSSRRRTSNRSSPTTSTAPSTTVQSPPATRLRSRKVSTSTSVANAQYTAPTSPSTSKGKGKGKAKQVEFSNEVDVLPTTPPKRSIKEREKEREHFLTLGDESDLTELEELEQSLSTWQNQVSPRRLRSKDRDIEKTKEKDGEQHGQDVTPVAKGRRAKKGVSNRPEVPPLNGEVNGKNLRITPSRKAKGKIGSPRESEIEEEHLDEDEEDQLVEEEEDDEDEEVGEDQDLEEEEEVDELVSSASITPPHSIGRRTPLRRRLRPRRTQPTSTRSDNDAADEGDDEGEGEPEEEIEDEVQYEDEEVEEEDEPVSSVEPRKLRSGKIVGEEDVEMEAEEEDVGDEEAEEDGNDVEEDGDDEEDAEDEVEEDGDVEAEDVDVDADGDTDETMEEDVDLTVATARTLVRLRRDDLVRLCETRDLDPVGTKPQLAEALLQWRDRHANDFSSPSSTGTVRPPSTSRKRRRTKGRQQSSARTTPVLPCSEQIQPDETPIPSKEKEDELELDLESLGLEDREIPPEKLQKLEKIGSGGFKDVFIGKFKGRRIAISEFRGQLSSMDIKELKLLGGFDHPNIVRFLGVSIPENTKETPVMIVSELCSNGDLFDYVRNVGPPSLHKVLMMMLDIAQGLEYLHKRKPSIIHRDCKSSNILITAKGIAKIADFGLAKVKQSTRSMVRSLVGTVNWQAPELWHAHPKYNHKVDVFSCAMVFWEMLQWHLPNKKFPWEGMNEHAIYEVVGTKRQRPPLTGLRKQWCPEIVDLIERMWAQEHADRPTMSEVVEALQELVSTH